MSYSPNRTNFSSTTSYVFAAEYCLSQNGYYSSEITGVAFDPCHELLWTAHASGKVKSYQCGSVIQDIHSFNNIGSKIEIFEVYEDMILCGTSNSLFGFQRNGQKLFQISSPNFYGLRAAHRPVFNNNLLYVAGASNACFTVDLEAQTVTQVFPVADPTSVVAMKANNSCVLSVHESGFVSVMPLDGSSGYNFIAHSGPLTGMDVFGDLIVTAGHTISSDIFHQHMKSAQPDNYLKLFDLRYPTELPRPADLIPMPCPKHFFFTDTYTGSRAVVASHNSQVHSVDLQTHHINTIVSNYNQYGNTNHSAISSSCQVFANVDDNQTIRLYALHSELQGTHGVVNFKSYPFSFSTPNGLPEEYNHSRDYYGYYKNNYYHQNQTQQEAQIDGSFGLNYLSLNDSIENAGVCRNPSSSSTNSYDYSFLMDARYLLKSASRGPMPIYPRDFFLEFTEYDLRCQLTATSPWDCGKLEGNIPKFYSQPNTKCILNRTVYEKFNTSSQVPLLDCAEAPFVSSVIRALSAVPILRKLVLAHLCRVPNCLLCEVHFIIRNINGQENDGSRIPVTCTGMVREMSSYKNFETIRRFRPLSFAGICTSTFCNFLFTHIFSSTKTIHDQEALEKISSYTKTTQISKETCGSCGSLETTEFSRHVIHLKYTFYDWNQNTPFVQLLEQSFAAGGKNSEQMAQCKKCHRRANRRDMGHDVILPSVLVIDTNMTKDGYIFWNHNADAFCRRPPNSMKDVDERFSKEFLPHERKNGSYFEKHLRNVSQAVHSSANGWSSYLPSMISASRDGSGYVSFSSSIEKEPNRKIYALCAAIMCIGDNFKGGRVLAVCKNPKPNNPLLNWTIFNDYIVTAVKEQEALYTHSSWKLPHMLFYCEVDSLNAICDPILIPKNFLTDFKNTAVIPDLTTANNLIPEPGELVALDSEFVKSDSQQKEHVLGRVSCINKDGKVIIDDYSLLSTGEKISDYLTQYSGIEAEDLDPSKSKKFLLSRKLTFFKVLFLIGNKNVFVGHALQNDFKIMNIYIPKTQCIDTSELYRLEGRQFLKLRDLVKIVFGDEIQSSSHDSIEDAMYSLKLYNHYKTCVESKTDMTSWLQAIYDESQKQSVTRQRNSPVGFSPSSNLNLFANFPSYLYST